VKISPAKSLGAEGLCVVKPNRDYGSNRHGNYPDGCGAHYRITPEAKPTYGEPGASWDLRPYEITKQIGPSLISTGASDYINHSISATHKQQPRHAPSCCASTTTLDLFEFPPHRG
jgi:hypothetical protein